MKRDSDDAKKPSIRLRVGCSLAANLDLDALVVREVVYSVYLVDVAL